MSIPAETSAPDAGGSSATVDSSEQVPVEPVRSTADLLEDRDDVVDNNGNKLGTGGSSSPTLASSGSRPEHDAVSSPVKLGNVTLTPLKHFLSSSPSRGTTMTPSRGTTSTPSKVQRSAVDANNQDESSSRTPSKSPRSKSKSPMAKKSSTPSAASKATSVSKSPMSSPRQRSLLEMFSSSAAKTSTDTSMPLSEPLDCQPAAELDDGQKMDTSSGSDQQHALLDQTVSHSLDHTEHAVVSSLNHTQLTANDTQQSTIDHTQPDSLHCTQSVVVDPTQPSGGNDTQQTMDHTQQSVVNHTQEGCLEHTQHAVADNTEAELSEDGQKADDSPRSEHRNVSPEVLVEDSQMAGTSPVRVVDTQEPLFIDETPPDGKSSDPAITADGTGLQLGQSWPPVSTRTRRSNSTQLPAMGSAATESDTDQTPDRDVAEGQSQRSRAGRADKEKMNTGAADARTESEKENGKSSGDGGGMQLEMVHDVVVIADSSEEPDDEVLQQTVIHVDATGTDVDEMWAKTDGCIDIEASQAGEVHASDPFIRSTSVSAVTFTEDSHEDIDTQSSILDLTQPSAADHTQPSSPDDTQLSVINRTQPSSLDHIQHTAPASTPASNTDDGIAMDTDLEEDVPLVRWTQSRDANRSTSSDDDVPLTQLMSSERSGGDDSGRPAYVASLFKFGQRRRLPHGNRMPAEDAASRRGKDAAVHATLRGRVKRRVIETRTTRLNLRTRSIHRVTSELVSAGARAATKLAPVPPPPSQPPIVRRRGRPKASKPDKSSHPAVTKSKLEPEADSDSSVSTRTRRSVGTDSAAAEVQTDKTDGTVDKDVAESAAEQSLANGDLCTCTLEKFGEVNEGSMSEIETPDTVCVIAECCTKADVKRGYEVVDVDDSAGVTGVEETRNGVEISHEEEDVGVNTGIEPASELPATDCFSRDSGQGMVVNIPMTDGEVLETGSSGKPESMNLDEPQADEEENCSGRSEPVPAVDITAGDTAVDAVTAQGNVDDAAPALESSVDNTAAPVSISAMSSDDGNANNGDFSSDETELGSAVADTGSGSETSGTQAAVEKSTSSEASDGSGGGDNDELGSGTLSDLEKSTPTSEAGEECRWKVPTSSSVARGQSAAAAADAPPETPTSIPRRRIVSRGSLMLERAMQLRHSGSSPPLKSSPRTKPVPMTEHGAEGDTSEQSPSSVDRRSKRSGLSKLRVFSPSKSPSAGILRKRQLSSESTSTSGQSPSSPSSRVSRSDVLCNHQGGSFHIPQSGRSIYTARWAHVPSPKRTLS